MKRLFLLALMIIVAAPALASDAELREYGRVFADAKMASDFCQGVMFNEAFFRDGIGGKSMTAKKEKKILVESITPRIKEIEETMDHYGVEYWCITYKHLTSQKYKAPRSPVIYEGLERDDDRFHEDG